MALGVVLGLLVAAGAVLLRNFCPVGCFVVALTFVFSPVRVAWRRRVTVAVIAVPEMVEGVAGAVVGVGEQVPVVSAALACPRRRERSRMGRPAAREVLAWEWTGAVPSPSGPRRRRRSTMWMEAAESTRRVPHSRSAALAALSGEPLGRRQRVRDRARLMHIRDALVPGVEKSRCTARGPWLGKRRLRFACVRLCEPRLRLFTSARDPTWIFTAVSGPPPA